MPDGTYNQRRIFPEDSGTGEEDKKEDSSKEQMEKQWQCHQVSCSKFCSIAQLLSNIRYFELKKPKTGMPKRQMLSICQKEGYSVAELTDIQNELR